MTKHAPQTTHQRSVVVLGAGIVGVSCALHLQRQGWQVTLIDRKEPGSETSYGNAGVISESAIVPNNMPALWRNLATYASNKGPSLKYNPAHLAKNISWLARYLACANSANAARRVAAYADLVQSSIDDHKALIKESGAQKHLRDTGWLKLYRTKTAYDRAEAEREILREFNVGFEELSRDGILEIEPDLKPIFHSGCLIRSASSVDNPGKVTAAYGRLFEKRGGQIHLASAQKLKPISSGYSITAARTGGQTEIISAAHIVVALGAWSMDLLKPLGYRLPLGVERGYHCHYRTDDGASLSRPCMDIEAGYALIPMEQGYRVTTGVELAGRDSPPTPTQLSQVVPLVKQAFPLGGAISNEIWLGRRPSMPDSLPVIGKAPKHERLWFAFGHGHNGFGLGPSTGRALAELMSNGASSIDISGLSPTRFG